MNKITIIDVAKAAGVSKSTVSRVISGKGRISEQTKNNILDVMRKLDYHPNAIARSLVYSKTFNIGIVMPASRDDFYKSSFFQNSIRGISTIARNHNYDVLISSSSNDVDVVKKFINLNKVDGVILMRAYENDECLKILSASKLPFVLIGTAEGYDDIYHVDNDNFSASYDLTNYMISKCDGGVAFVASGKGTSVSKARFAGYRQAFEDSPFPLHDDHIILSDDLDFLKEYVTKLLSCPTPPKGFITLDDNICLLVIGIIKELHLEIPRDVKIASFNNSPFTKLFSPPITAVEIFSETLGESACQTIIDAIEGNAPPKRTVIDHQINYRTSTSTVSFFEDCLP